MKSLSVKLGVILIGLAVFGYAEVWGANWELFEMSVNENCFIDLESMDFSSKNFVKVWVKRIYTDKGKTEAVLQMGKKYENLDHSLQLMEINCADRTSKILSGIFYSKENEIFRFDSHSANWKVIVPDTPYEALYKLLCR